MLIPTMMFNKTENLGTTIQLIDHEIIFPQFQAKSLSTEGMKYISLISG